MGELLDRRVKKGLEESKLLEVEVGWVGVKSVPEGTSEKHGIVLTRCSLSC